MIESWFSSPIYVEDNVDKENINKYKKENKKHGKNKQRNKKNSEGRMFDPSTSI